MKIWEKKSKGAEKKDKCDFASRVLKEKRTICPTKETKKMKKFAIEYLMEDIVIVLSLRVWQEGWWICKSDCFDGNLCQIVTCNSKLHSEWQE